MVSVRQKPICKASHQDVALLQHKGGENDTTSLKEGVDMRFSERKFIRDHSQITMTVVNEKEFERQLH